MMTVFPSFSKYLLVLVGCLLVACGRRSGGDGLNGEVRVDGSSTVYPVTEAAAEDFRYVEPGVRVTVGVSGTGGGFKKFIRGETDISNASRPISEEELESCRKNGIEFVELPVAYDGLVVVVHKGNNFVDYFTVEELKRIWEPAAQGKINRWNQIRKAWPDHPFNLYGPGVASGTYDYFTEAVVGEAKSSRGDFTASEDDNVLVQGVSKDKSGLGFFGLAYYEENQDKLKVVPVDGGDGPVLPTIETVSDGTYQPLARPEFIYVNVKSLERPHVEAFVRFYLENAAELVKSVQYIPLEDEAYRLTLKRMEQKITGTAFGEGRSVVGVKMTELLQVEADSAKQSQESRGNPPAGRQGIKTDSSLD